jgi:hypothetical protein
MNNEVLVDIAFWHRHWVFIIRIVSANLTSCFRLDHDLPAVAEWFFHFKTMRTLSFFPIENVLDIMVQLVLQQHCMRLWQITWEDYSRSSIVSSYDQCVYIWFLITAVRCHIHMLTHFCAHAHTYILMWFN